MISPAPRRCRRQAIGGSKNCRETQISNDCTLKTLQCNTTKSIDPVPTTQVSAEKARISSARRSMVAETGDQSLLSGTLAPVAAGPSKIKIMARHFCDSITTIARTPRTSISATARAMGSPFAVSGAASKTRQSSRTTRAVRLGADRQRVSVRTTEALAP